MSTKSRAAATAMAALLVLSVTGGALALTVDTETSETSSTSDLTNSSVITEPHNSSITQNIEVDGDGLANTTSLANPETAFTLAFVVNDTGSPQNGETIYQTTDNWTETSLSGSSNHYNYSIDNPTWGNELEYGDGENVTVEAVVTFNESESDEANTTIRYTVDPTDGTARAEFGANERQVEGNKTIFGLSVASIPFAGSDVGAAQVNDSVNVTDTTSTITMDVDNTSAVDSFAEAASTDNDLTTDGYVLVNGQMVPLLVGSSDAPNWLDTDTDAYATVSEDGETVTVENANETWDSGTTSVDVEAVGNDASGFFKTRSMMLDYGASQATAATTAAGAVDPAGSPFESEA
ncbi:hypothetical protein [Haloarcula sp. JP-L23]|uniref:hypothetical protein n=1 Tax=Haloarcula sp. JP-L23 TaxID=2716717 RepID=UPI00140EEC9C|nr:hypothetical protein G9465_24465 [Haloarcula sp. JP-L23]